MNWLMNLLRRLRLSPRLLAGPGVLVSDVLVEAYRPPVEWPPTLPFPAPPFGGSPERLACPVWLASESRPDRVQRAIESLRLGLWADAEPAAPPLTEVDYCPL